MTSSPVIDKDLVPLDVRVDNDFIYVRFSGGLQTATPVELFPRLKNATVEQRKAWRLIGRGHGVHWPDADEDITVHGLIRLATSTISGVLPEVA